MPAKLKLYGPVAVSALCLAGALYFSLTNSAYVIRGCREEDFPELAFILFTGPVALIALVVSIASVRANVTLGVKRIMVGVSLLLSLLSILLTLWVLFEPGGNVCR